MTVEEEMNADYNETVADNSIQFEANAKRIAGTPLGGWVTPNRGWSVLQILAVIARKVWSAATRESS